MIDLTPIFTIVGAIVTAVLAIALIGYALGIFRFIGGIEKDDDK
jgi:hypothetical protein